MPEYVSPCTTALARSADAERKAAGWHAESERQSQLLREVTLLQRQREEDDRAERASRERYDMERVQALEAATKAAAAAKALAAEERALRQKLEDELRAKPPRRFLTVGGRRAARPRCRAVLRRQLTRASPPPPLLRAL